MPPIILTIKAGCPICNGDLRGNNEYKYLCPRCMLYFEEKDLKQGLLLDR